MANGIEFETAITTAGPAPGDEKIVRSIPIEYRKVPLADGTEADSIVTCYKFTGPELDEILATGKVYFCVLGLRMAPQMCSAFLDFRE